MKNFIILFLSFLFAINSSFAINPADFLNKTPNNFTPECYEYYNKIDKSDIRNNNTNEIYNTYKIDIDKISDLVITQFGFILPYKFYSDLKNSYSYENNLGIDNKSLNDFNDKTFYNFDAKTQSEIILSFDNKIEKNSFSFIFNYSSNILMPEYYISLDNKNWDLIKKYNLTDFDFKYLKINFINKDLLSSQIYRENIKIYELNFTKKSNTILVKSFFDDNIEIYSKFNCKQKDFSTNALNYDSFPINSDTKTIEIKSKLNPKYNVYTEKDFDNDWVPDESDNCKTRYNPKQSDINGDGKGDICSDDDNDGKIGYYDNCINIYNPDQKDINRNGVGDKCEFDKDSDGIFDKLDNCINTANPEQKDSDKDNIGDVCDNCKYYNPAQLDKNENNIGDVCEQKENFLKENDKDSDGIIDFQDNCKEIANKNQADFDKDGIGDICDNCINFQNKDQLDFDKNLIGDICEDSDGDGIEGITDNCINIANPDQNDSDNNGVGDLCEDSDGDKVLFVNDNCPYIYNPEQSNIDSDEFGDKCDLDDNRFIESNKEIFIALLVLLVLIFGFSIFKMVKKLK